MTKISKLILGAGALGVLGITALPLASYAAVDVALEVTVQAQDDTTGATGGNNAKGYTWAAKDPDTKVNLGTVDATGVTSGGIAPVTSPMDFVASGTTAEYGVKFTPVGTSGGPVLTDVVGTYLAISNADQIIGKTSAPGNIRVWPTGVALNPSQGVYFGTKTEGGLDSQISITARWNSALAVGSYKNTVTISQTSNP